jgi:hypothetical protein
MVGDQPESCTATASCRAGLPYGHDVVPELADRRAETERNREDLPRETNVFSPKAVAFREDTDRQ